ncbi:MAG TPA: hypothetical protein VJK02_03720 [Anaerolineales bacterium]|nr:hypothetical protein [Anaerolineales bacterium]
MSNLYVTPAEIKDNAPDAIRAATTKYDDVLTRMAGNASRDIDRWCRRVFYPWSGVRTFNGGGKRTLWIDDVISISQLRYSDDNGATYTALAQLANWHLARADDYNHPGSYDRLVIDPNSLILGVWPSGIKSVEVTGIWAYADDRAQAFEATGLTVANDPLAAGATSVTASADATGDDQFKVSPAVGAGMLLRLELEYLECTDVATVTLTVLRGRNGTTDAAHAKLKPIEVWRPPEPVKEAAAIMAVRRLQRALQGYADASADVDLGRLRFVRGMDPEAERLLWHYRKPGPA